MIQDNTSILLVKDGVATIQGMQIEHSTNVDSKGRFRLEVLTDEKIRKQNGLSGQNSLLTFIYKGSLLEDESIGAFAHGRGPSKNTRCSTTMKIKKLSPV